MKRIQLFYKKIRSLKWYYQLGLTLAIIVLVALLVTFLIWFIPILIGSLLLLYIFTGEEIFSTMRKRYEQRKQVPINPLFTNVYNWLTEKGVTGLPISTSKFTQGVEFSDFTQGVYFIHIQKEISDDILGNFEVKTRQIVKLMSDGLTDCIVTRFKREPFLAIKVRLVSTDEILLQNNQVEEDF